MRKSLSFLLLPFVLSSVVADGQSMRILHYGEISQAIMEVYEVEFYDDGLVKTIREYFNPKSNLETREEANQLRNLSLESIRRVERDLDGIKVLIEKNGASPVLQYRVDVVDNKTITAIAANTGDRLVYQLAETVGTYSAEWKGEPLFRYGETEKGLRLEHLYSGSEVTFTYDSARSRYVAIQARGKVFGSFEIGVDYASDGRYTIVRPDLELGHGRFLDKFEIDVPRVEFSREAAAVNYLLCPFVHAEYLLPFFTHPMVPAVEETAATSSDDDYSCGGLY